MTTQEAIVGVAIIAAAVALVVTDNAVWLILLPLIFGAMQ